MEIKTIDDLLAIQQNKLDMSCGESGLGMSLHGLLIKRFIEEINMLKESLGGGDGN